MVQRFRYAKAAKRRTMTLRSRNSPLKCGVSDFWGFHSTGSALSLRSSNMPHLDGLWLSTIQLIMEGRHPQMYTCVRLSQTHVPSIVPYSVIHYEDAPGCRRLLSHTRSGTAQSGSSAHQFRRERKRHRLPGNRRQGGDQVMVQLSGFIEQALHRYLHESRWWWKKPQCEHRLS